MHPCNDAITRPPYYLSPYYLSSGQGEGGGGVELRSAGMKGSSLVAERISTSSHLVTILIGDVQLVETWRCRQAERHAARLLVSFETGQINTKFGHDIV